MPIRSLAAVLANTVLNVPNPRRLLRFSKSLLKFPLEYSAAQALEEVPVASFGELFKATDLLRISVDREALNRHHWNVKLHEEVYLSAAVQLLKPMRIFEFGTFNGNTTRCLAESAPENAQVFTVDLPDESFEASQTVESSSRIGERYDDSPARAKIQQIRADTMSFDFSPYYGSIDFVFVDAGHNYADVLSDSRNALKMARPGGTIFWHDFEPGGGAGVVHATRDATAGLPLYRLGGTSFAVLRVPVSTS
jgi:predicted O-methyltransferase YrrM